LVAGGTAQADYRCAGRVSLIRASKPSGPKPALPCFLKCVR
jgi:hypothetical protein